MKRIEGMKGGAEGEFCLLDRSFRLLCYGFVPSPPTAGLRGGKSSLWLSFDINGGLTCIEILHEKVDA